MNKGIGIVIGFTKDGVPMRKERLQTHSSEKRPLRRTQGELEFRLPIHPAITPVKGGGAIVGGVYYYQKDIPGAVRNLKESEA